MHSAKRIRQVTKQCRSSSQDIDENVKYFGYGYIKDPAHLVPNVGLTFWSFRIMVGLGGYFILFFIIVLIVSKKRNWLICAMVATGGFVDYSTSLYRSQAGWVVAEVGQPWAIQDMLPVGAAISNCRQVPYSLLSLSSFYCLPFCSLLK